MVAIYYIYIYYNSKFRPVRWCPLVLLVGFFAPMAPWITQNASLSDLAHWGTLAPSDRWLNAVGGMLRTMESEATILEPFFGRDFGFHQGHHFATLLTTPRPRNTYL